MDLKQYKIGYTVELEEGENIKILVNDNQVFEETVQTGFIAKVRFDYLQSKESDEGP